MLKKWNLFKYFANSKNSCFANISLILNYIRFLELKATTNSCFKKYFIAIISHVNFVFCIGRGGNEQKFLGEGQSFKGKLIGRNLLTLRIFHTKMDSLTIQIFFLKPIKLKKQLVSVYHR
jgi:hypothetical protein